MKFNIGNWSILVIALVIIFTGFSFGNRSEAYSLGCSEYGMAYEDYGGYCKCMSGYVMGESLGRSYCVSGTSVCYDKYGYGSEYDSLSNSCECSYGYVFGKDIFGETQCISETKSCQDQYGYNSRSTYGGKCECSYGYVFNDSNQCEYGETVCSRKHGSYSSYDSLSNSCECDEGYKFDDDNKCVEKQNNAYFWLLAIDESSDSIIVQSDYSKQNYLLEYGIGCGLYIDNYLDEKLVINLGTDFDIDMFDKIVLQDHNSTCSIMSYDATSDDSFEEEEELFYTPPKTSVVTPTKITTSKTTPKIQPKTSTGAQDKKTESEDSKKVKEETKVDISSQTNTETKQSMELPKVPWYKRFFSWVF